MTALQGWIVIGLLVLIMLGIVGLGAEIYKTCRTYGGTSRLLCHPSSPSFDGPRGREAAIRQRRYCSCLLRSSSSSFFKSVSN
jgi:hypothetical protein